MTITLILKILEIKIELLEIGPIRKMAKKNIIEEINSIFYTNLLDIKA